MSETEKGSAQVASARLIRRLGQLRSAYAKKLGETVRTRQLWAECKWSPVLFNQFTRCYEETKAKYDQVIASSEELELCVDEKVWQEQYEDKKQDVEREYSRLIEAVGDVAVEFEAACTEQRQREAAAVVGGGGVAPAGGGPAAAGPGYRAERALCPEELSVDCTGLEYKAFLRAWDSYYVTSRFALAPVVTQIAYLTNCLVTDLMAKLQFGGCGTMAEELLVIDLDFKARNQLTVRRLQFSRCKQERRKHTAIT